MIVDIVNHNQSTISYKLHIIHLIPIFLKKNCFRNLFAGFSIMETVFNGLIWKRQKIYSTILITKAKENLKTSKWGK